MNKPIASISRWLALLVMTGVATAAPVLTTATNGPNSPSTTTDELAYAADISSSDLLHGLVGVTGGAAFGVNGATPAGLNDGLNGGDYEADGLPALVGAAWPSTTSTIEYDLGVGTGEGYDITEIQSISAWQDLGLSNQNYNVLVKYLGDTGFTALTTVTYQPFNSGGGSNKVNVTDDTGVLASGIEAIKFEFLATAGHSAGSVYREINVIGVETISGPDETPPTVDSLSPVNGGSGVLPGTNLVVTFDENIAIGTGNITIKNLDAPSEIDIPVGDGQISVSGAVLTINPATDLAAGTHYAVQIDATAIDDTTGNSFAGIDNDTTWNFTTSVPDLTDPLLSNLSPADNSIDVPLASDLVVTFDENIAIGSGNISIKDLDASSETAIPVGDAQISISGAVMTINPSSNLDPDTNYAVQISTAAITDLSGNPFAGITDDTTWNFVTADEPLRIMCLGDSITVGYTDNPGWNNHPFMFGYRSGLYTRLTNAGYNFQFVGGSTEPWTGISGDPTHGGTYTPALDLRDFGQDGHRGYGGAGIWGNVNGWINADNPDIILLLIGINGMGGGSQTALTNLVSSIVTHAPDVHLIVAQITPYANFNQTLYDYNLYVRDTLVPGHVTAGHKVSTVDLYSFFLTDPSTYTTLPSTTGAIAPGVLSNGINHPDNPHYDLMAQEWFEGIEALGFGSVNFSSWISDPAFGLAVADQGFGDDSDGDQLSNGLEAWFGTHPGQFNTGLGDVSTVGHVTTFTHPQNSTVPDDLTGYYEWSPNLTDWFASGNGPDGGATVTFSASTSGSTTTVTATASQGIDRLFLRAGVKQD